MKEISENYSETTQNVCEKAVIMTIAKGTQKHFQYRYQSTNISWYASIYNKRNISNSANAIKKVSFVN
jgi:hypothetical protein